MSNDPFATDTDNEDDVDVPEETVVDAAGTEVSVTLKGGSGFDAPWVVLRAPSAREALAQLNDDDTLKALVDKASKVGQYFAGLGGSSSGGGGSKPARQQAPNGETKQCQHGEMIYRSGVSKKSGKPYKMFTCPSGDRDNECDPVFVR